MKRIVILGMLLVLSVLSAELRDLNKFQQNFILETKKITIPGFPDAFNPSIVRWKGRLLLSFRAYDPRTRSTDSMGVVWLDEALNVVGTPTLLKRDGEVAGYPSQAKDPRLVVVNDQLYMVYSNVYPFPQQISRMYVGKVTADSDENFEVQFPSPLIYYDNEIRGRKEKNWVPFVHNNSLLLSYSIQPHKVFLPTLDKNSCTTVAITTSNLSWNWGELRGGTPALLVDDRYLAFFHSDKALATVQSDGIMMNHYFMGAYTFQSEFPFALTAISTQPIVTRSFYEGPMYKTWKPLRVVFPGGFVSEGNTILLAYGRQDHEVWIVKLDKARLLASLKPVTPVGNQ